MESFTTRQQVDSIKRRFTQLMAYLNTGPYNEQAKMRNLFYHTKSQVQNSTAEHIYNTSQLLNVQQVLWVLQIGRSTLYNLINQRQLTAVKIGDRTLFRPKDLENYINNLKQYGDR